MRTTIIWLFLVGAMLLLGDAVSAWNRQFFNRYSRNLLRNAGDFGGGGGGGGMNIGNGGGGSSFSGAASNAQLEDFNAIFGLNNDVSLRAAAAGAGGGSVGGNSPSYGYGAGLNTDVDAINFGAQQQQPEVYGIVEPLIEDTPCVDRPCQVNDDCCPTGVCVNTYGEGKCIYVYGRKRDLCHRNTDCEPGMSCVKSAGGFLMCQPTTSAMHLLNVGGGGGGGAAVAGAGGMAAGGAIGLGLPPPKSLDVKQFGEDCASSNDCNVTKGMCCQLQRSHHRMRPRKLCAYFRDPFMCIDIMPTEDEEIRESRFLSAFSQRRM